MGLRRENRIVSESFLNRVLLLVVVVGDDEEEEEEEDGEVWSGGREDIERERGFGE